MSRSNLVTISMLCGYAAGAMVTALIVIMGQRQGIPCRCHEEELEPADHGELELELEEREALGDA